MTYRLDADFCPVTLHPSGASADDDSKGQGSRSNVRLTEEVADDAPRLLVVSNKARNCMVMQTAALPNVTYVQYKYDSGTLDGVAGSIMQHLGTNKVHSMAFVFHSNSSTIFISGKDEKTITRDITVAGDESRSVCEFFAALLERHLNAACGTARLDILACVAAHNAETAAIAQVLSAHLSLPVAISKDLMGSQLPGQIADEDSHRKIMYVGDLYFRMERLRNWSGDNRQTLAGFEKIRTVGKGAYGTAVLYKKKDDNSLVILKELNLHDMNASERNMALNEVCVLAMLDHPNIISYYDSFEEDGTVIIEMEYADGGTLAQYLSQQVEPLDERKVVGMFQQVVAAIKYIHEHNILHRDLKTANIFLTKEGAVKVGDFGISKLMSTTHQAASTVLGTPYYISPEMCEAKPYKDKSDIWALGCILYEMVCKQKTFEGSNLPALVNKIMKGHFAPVKGSYSQQLKDLIECMLQNDPELRPSAADIWSGKLPELLSQYEEPLTDYDDDLMTSSDNAIGRRSKRTRSVLYYFEMADMSLHPSVLPSRIRIREVAVGSDHVIVVTTERMVYTWGEGDRGQLGHGDDKSKSQPQLVHALKGKSIIKACCGDGFSVFASDNGIVMTCGDGSAGCLGHADWCSTSKPRLIEALLSVDVTHIACGPHHVVALGGEHEVFTWGRGAHGRLGHGSEEDFCQPMKVHFTETVCIRDCYCGEDGTMLLSDVGTVLACGNNEYNKLGLNQRQGFLMAMKNIFNKAIAGEKEFTVVKALVRHRVIAVAMGRHHSAALVEAGRVYTLGRNSEGQLGMGNSRTQNAPVEVKLFEDRPALRIRCGEYYTVAATVDNDLLFWGTRFKVAPPADDITKADNERSTDTTDDLVGHQPSAENVAVISDGGGMDLGQENDVRHRNPETGEGSMGTSGDATHQQDAAQASDVDNSLDEDSSSDKKLTTPSNRGFRPLSSSRPRTSDVATVLNGDSKELILQPVPLIRMDSSGSRSQAGDTVTLSNVFCHADNLFIQVETTAPPPTRRRSRRKRYFRKRFAVPDASSTVTRGDASRAGPRRSASSRDGGDEYSSEASELDTRASIPTWLRQELASCEANDGNEADNTSEDDTSSPLLNASISSSMSVNTRLQSDTASRTDAVAALGAEVPISFKHTVPGREKRTLQTTTLVQIGANWNVLRDGSSSSSKISANQLSSSSSSGALAASLRNSRLAKDHVVKASPHVLVCKPRLPISGQSFKSKAPSPTDKHSARVRSRGKTRRYDGHTDGNTSSTSTSVQRNSLEQLQMELDRLATQKCETESRVRSIEEENRRQLELISSEASQRSKQREERLKLEVDSLRQKLEEQNHKLEDNESVVISLQKKLVEIQHEQERMLESHCTHHPTSPAPPRDSRICAIQ